MIDSFNKQHDSTINQKKTEIHSKNAVSDPPNEADTKSGASNSTINGQSQSNNEKKPKENQEQPTNQS